MYTLRRLIYTLAALSAAIIPFGNILKPDGVGGVDEKWNIYSDPDGRPVPLLGLRDNNNTLRFGWVPCSCQDYTCGCCMGMDINFADFHRHGCMNFTYLPMEFAIEMNVLMNEESVFKRNVSAKNPPPACMEIPINYLPKMQFCVKLFDIFTPGRNLHMCVDFETKIERATVLVLQFDCFVMGEDGFSHVKPTQPTSNEGGENKNSSSNFTEVEITIPPNLSLYVLQSGTQNQIAAPPGNGLSIVNFNESNSFSTVYEKINLSSSLSSLPQAGIPNRLPSESNKSAPTECTDRNCSSNFIQDINISSIPISSHAFPKSPSQTTIIIPSNMSSSSSQPQIPNHVPTQPSRSTLTDPSHTINSSNFKQDFNISLIPIGSQSQPELPNQVSTKEGRKTMAP